MSNEEKLSRALQILATIEPVVEQPNAVIISAYDNDGISRGNVGGLVQLSIAALTAALGVKQSFRDQHWVINMDQDRALEGFGLDELAHLYLPTTKTRLQRITASVLAFCFVSAFLTILIVGLFVVVRWLFHYL